MQFNNTNLIVGAHAAVPESCFRRHPLFAFGLLVSFLLLLAACGGGAETRSTTNPDSDNDRTTGGGNTADQRAFKLNVWDNLAGNSRCGQCHGRGQAPKFVDLDLNVAYTQAIQNVDLTDPANSRLVTKVASGHNCWLASDSACAAEITNYIEGWVNGSTDASGRDIVLIPPVIKDPGATKNFPADPSLFQTTVYPLLTSHCAGCHAESSATPQAPFFASNDLNAAYSAVRTKLDLNNPENSRLVLRLREEFHNCWSVDCQSDAQAMEDAITRFAEQVPVTELDPTLITSKALQLADGVIASGGNRHEANLIGLWEFQTGQGNIAYDTSGVIGVNGETSGPLNLTLIGNVNWVSGYGVEIGNGGKLQASTAASKKLYDFISASEEYSLEAWVVPANVTQEDTSIITYSSGATNRNMMLGQTLYSYDYYNRSDATVANNNNILSTADGDRDLQASLQHVVVTFDPVNGRKIYVNGVYTDDADSVATPGDSLRNVWDEISVLVLGNEPSGGHQWLGKVRLLAIHNRALTAEQVLQNFEAGVGQKYFLLFSISDRIGVPDSYIMFEVSQFDNYSYFFYKPTFINLDSNWTPSSGFTIRGIRIGINGREAAVGQAYINKQATISSSSYTPNGQVISNLGTIISLESGAEVDEFFLTFEVLKNQTRDYTEDPPVAPAPPADAAPASRIGIRDFAEINASMSGLTGISASNAQVVATYDSYKQQLPSVEAIETFLPSHQMAVAQLAMSYCNELVAADKSLPINDANRYFPGFDFSRTAGAAFDATGKAQIVDPLLSRMMNVGDLNNDGSPLNLTTQPAVSTIRAMLTSSSTLDLDGSLSGDAYESLMTNMLQCLPGCDTTTRTEEVVIATCAAVLGSAVMLIQ